MAPGIHATTTLSHMEIVSILISGLERSSSWMGIIFFQKNTTTANIAPSWITTKNISLKRSLMFSVRNSSTSSMWPVLLIGSHSVIPSTIPRKIAFKISIKSILPSVCQQSGSFPPCCYTHIKGGGSRPNGIASPPTS